jgi:hypothetical protein
VLSVNALVINQFTDGVSTGNFTYVTGLESPTKTIFINSYSAITNAYLYLTGYGEYTYANISESYIYGMLSNGGIRGNWTRTSDVLNVQMNNPGYSNDQNKNTYTEINFSSAASTIGYIINFSVETANLMYANVTINYSLADTWSPARTLMCYDQATTLWYTLGVLPVGTQTEITYSVPISSSCLLNDQFRVWLLLSAGTTTARSFNFSEIWVNATHYNLTGNTYPHNVSILMNNQSVAYNYGLTHLNHTVLANITTAFNSSSITLWNLSFRSNTTSTLEYKGLSITATRNFTINFFDERDRTVFKLNQTNETFVTVYCGDSATEYSHITSGTVYINSLCYSYDLIKVSVSMNDQPTYYRTLLSKNTEIDFYLVNLYENRSIVQIIYNLFDLNGRWANSQVIISRFVNSTNASIIEQRFDVDNKVYLWLMKDSSYNITVVNSYGETFRGSFIADQAETKNLYLPSQDYRDNPYFIENIRWSYYFNSTEHAALFHYEDYSDIYDSKTTFLNFSFRWADNDSTIYYDQISGSPITIYNFVYAPAFVGNATNYVKGNTSYIIEWWAVNTELGILHGKTTVGTYSLELSRTGFSDNEFNDILKIGGLIFLIVILLSFGSRYSHIGGVIVFVVATLFKIIGLFDWITTGALIIVGIIAVINYIRREEVSVG